MCEFSAYVAFIKATNRQTDVKHETGKQSKTEMSASLLIVATTWKKKNFKHVATAPKGPAKHSLQLLLDSIKDITCTEK